MGAPIDLTRQTFGLLTVVKRFYRTDRKGIWWECRCVCGSTKVVQTGLLRHGSTKSCGCMKKLLKLPTSIIQHRNRIRSASMFYKNKGVLGQVSCEKCGDPNSEMHHVKNYSHPLAVKWLCRPCHLKIHNRIRANQRELRRIMAIEASLDPDR